MKNAVTQVFYYIVKIYFQKITLLFVGIQKDAAFLLTDKFLSHVTTNQQFFKDGLTLTVVFCPPHFSVWPAAGIGEEGWGGGKWVAWNLLLHVIQLADKVVHVSC